MPETTTATSGEILLLEDAKRYLRIPENVHDEDDEIDGMIIAARREAEAITRRTLRQSVTRVETLKHWFNRFTFPHPPLHVTHAITIKYYDSDNTLQTVADSNYFVEPELSAGDINEGVSFLEFDTNYVKPILYDRRPTRIQITYTAGYGTEVTDNVHVARQSIKELLWAAYYGDPDEKKLKQARSWLNDIAFGFYA